MDAFLKNRLIVTWRRGPKNLSGLGQNESNGQGRALVVRNLGMHAKCAVVLKLIADSHRH